jgi:hypothetical protein
MTDYLRVAEVYLMQHRLIEIFGGLHGVRDKGAVEAAVFRPQTGYYNSIEEETAGFSVERDTRHDIPNPRPTCLNELAITDHGEGEEQNIPHCFRSPGRNGNVPA